MPENAIGCNAWSPVQEMEGEAQVEYIQSHSMATNIAATMV
jgi:hypothetical protein